MPRFYEKRTVIGVQLNLERTMFMERGCQGCRIHAQRNKIYVPATYTWVVRLSWWTASLLRRVGGNERFGESIRALRNWRRRPRTWSLFNSTVLPALMYVSETWKLRKKDENPVIECSIKRVMLGATCLTQVRRGILSFALSQQSKVRNAATQPIRVESGSRHQNYCRLSNCHLTS